MLMLTIVTRAVLATALMLFAWGAFSLAADKWAARR